MSAMYFLIGCSVFIAAVFLIAFIWANRTGQHDDTYTPSVRILFDDHPSTPTNKELKKTEEQPDRENARSNES